MQQSPQPSQQSVTAFARENEGRGASRRLPGTTTTATRRPADRRAGTAKNFESRPRDLNVEVPEFLPN